MLIALVQGVVGPFHEDFPPLDERGGKETGEGADEDFLEEGGVHAFLKAAEVPERRFFIKSPHHFLPPARELQNSPYHG